MQIKTIYFIGLLFVASSTLYGQCVGDLSIVSIPRNVGCSYGWGSNATWDGPVGGTINDPGGSESSFNVTWTTPGTYRFKRTFPSGCHSTVIYSGYYTVSAKPTTPLLSEVNQQTGTCGQVTLNYTGSSTSAYWQTSQYGVVETYPTTRTVTTTGTYYLRIKSSTGCWSDSRSLTVSSIPSSPVGGTLSGGGTYYGNANLMLSLNGSSGNIKEYRYTENGGSPIIVTNTTNSINVNYSNASSSIISRQYWAVLQLNGCETNSTSTTITLNPIPTPDASVYINKIGNYTCINNPPGGTYSEGATYYWRVTNGTITSSNSTLGSASATVDWGESGNGVIAFYFYGYATWSQTTKVEIPICYNTYTNCASTVVTQSNPLTPTASYEWWWQITPDGTSTALGKGSSVTLNTPGPLYLRSRLKNDPFMWSTNSQSLGTIQVFTMPSAPSLGTNAEGFYNYPVTLSVEPVQNATGYSWYSSLGAELAMNSTNVYVIPNLLSTTTVRASTLSGGCETSERYSVTATLVIPQIVNQGETSFIFRGAPVILAVDQPYDSYVWKNADNEIVGTGPTFSVYFPGAYTVTVTKSGLSGSGTSPVYNVQTAPYGQNINFIVTNSILVENVTVSSTVEALPPESNSQNIQYFDDLGRLSQVVSSQGSPLRQDIVQPIVYDELGRESSKYLPYVSGNTGWYKSNFISKEDENYTDPLISPQFDFYQSETNVAIDPTPYAVTIFEPSPLNRIVKQGAPGETWQPDGVNTYNSIDYTIKMGYEINTTGEVLRWAYTYPTTMYPLGLVNAGTATTPVYYPANELYKNKTKDEQGHEVIEYIDKQGRTVLKRVQATGSQTIDDTNYASTYYIYDDFDNLVCVIPPEGIMRLAAEYYHGAANDGSKNAFLKRWAFRYKYDGRKRMTEKQVPGAGSVYMVYDKRDRLVFTQDSVQRTSNQWLFTKYDALNRPVLTGIHTADIVLSQVEMQARVDDYYDNLSTNGGEWFETYDPNVVNNMHGYDNASYPTVTSGTTADPNLYMTVTYYDNYSFKDLLGSSVFDYKNDELVQSGNLEAQDATAFDRVIGLVTGTKVRMITTATWLKSVNYYDDKYRVIQTIAENPKGHEVSTSTYDFVGKVLRTKTSLYTGQPSQWTAVTSTTIDGELITGTSTGNWSAGAVSSQILPAEIDGWAEFTVTKTLNNVAFGLSDQNTSNHLSSIDFNWYMITPTAARPYMNSSSVGSSIAVQPGDVLRVERVNGKIYWKRNGLIIFPTSFPSTYSSSTQFMADVAFFNNGAAVSKVRLSSTFGNFSATAQSITKRFEYDHAGRLITTWHQLNNDDEILLAYNEYNELGQLVDKKLHSTIASATDARQSVDYRYNIRGWLTSINNSSLTADNTNDDENDFFGMNLAYNEDLGTGNTANLQYNGNISAIKYSAHLGTVKETGYNFEYDPMNRLKHANHLMNNNIITPNWTTGNYSENNLTYDLNGNIKTLQRTGDEGVQIDNLVYNYGTAGGNKLVYVWDQTSDATDKTKGFFDGNAGSSTDYTYDGNGNMLTDKNKNITANITYNHLNLPEKVTRNNSSVTYLYDAAGQKRGQIAQYGGGTKFTDYLGAWVFENNEPVFVQHEEGRIVLSETETVFTTDCEDETIATPTANVTVTTQTINGETYLKVAPAVDEILTKLGVTELGGTFSVTPGEQYVFRVKGYSNSTRKANLYVAGNGTDMLWAGANLPSAVAGQMTVENRITIPPNITNISLGVLYSNTSTSVAADFFYINSVELVLVKNTEPEYQYHLKDHLGNVRTTFTTKSEVESATATMETSSENEEAAEFLYYDEAVKINSSLFDHTNEGTTFYSTRLVGGDTTQRYGLAKSLSVMPGDTLRISVYAKYIDPDEESNWTTALQNFITSISQATAPPGTLVDGGLAGTTGGEVPMYFANLNDLKEDETGEAPMAYLNYLVFDRNWNFIDGGFKRLSTDAKENGTGVAHEKLEIIDTIRQAGYVYIYLSNESEEPVEVFFDDFNVEHSKSPVIQTDDYYPFGLTFNSNNRENSIPQKYKYNGKEEQTELGLGWLDYGARIYQPELGRFFTQDRFAEKYYPLSSYQYVANNPVGLVDINGDSIWVTQNKGVWTIHMTGKVLNLTNGEAPNAEDFMNRFKAAFSGIEGIELDMQFSDVSSIDEVSKSDHLIAIVDNVSDGNGVAERGGKVAYVEGGRAENSVLNTMVHEGGHLMGLNHGFATKTKDDDHINNMMNYPSRFASKDYRNHFTQGQASSVIEYWERGKLNYGSNSTQAPSNDPPQFVPSWLYNMYHSSTPTTPYRGEVKKGDRIPKPVQD